MEQNPSDSLTIKTLKGVTVVHFCSSLSQSQQLEEVVLYLQETVAELEQPRVVIDFTDVSFFPSTGVGVIVSTRNLIVEKHGVLALANMSELIEHMFTLTGLTKVLPVYDNVDEAVKAMSTDEA